MARERQITVTLRPRVWAEFERRRVEALAAGISPRGVDSEVLNDWLTECLLRAGSGDGAALPAPVAPLADDDDFGIDRSKL